MLIDIKVMEFASRQKCIEHYQNQFPNLPRYMVEMALEYDLQTSKPLTNKQKRQQKQTLKEHKAYRGSMNEQFKEAMESGKPLEIDCAKIVKGSDYKLPPFVKGYINVDGKDVAQSLHTNTIEEIKS